MQPTLIVRKILVFLKYVTSAEDRWEHYIWDYDPIEHFG